MYSSLKFYRNSNYVLRQVHGSYFLIDITDNYEDGKCRIVETNEIGAFIWDSLEKCCYIKDVADKLLSVIIGEVNPEDICNDVKDFILYFADRGLVGKEE